MKKNGEYYVIVVEDESTNKIVATGMLEIEQKFIHSCALVWLVFNLLLTFGHPHVFCFVINILRSFYFDLVVLNIYY